MEEKNSKQIQVIQDDPAENDQVSSITGSISGFFRRFGKKDDTLLMDPVDEMPVDPALTPPVPEDED